MNSPLPRQSQGDWRGQRCSHLIDRTKTSVKDKVGTRVSLQMTRLDVRRHVFLLIVNSEAKAGQLVHHCFASSSQTGNQHLFTLKGSRSLGLKFNRRK